MNDELKTIIQISIHRGLIYDEEKVILNYFKNITEADALDILKYMIEQKSLITVSIAKKVLHTKHYVKSFFEYGVVTSNAQTIKQWLEFAVSKLGIKSVIYLIDQLNNESNRLIDKAVYWLPLFIVDDDIKSRNLFHKLKEKIKISEIN